MTGRPKRWRLEFVLSSDFIPSPGFLFGHLFPTINDLAGKVLCTAQVKRAKVSTPRSLRPSIPSDWKYIKASPAPKAVETGLKGRYA